jgi:hypothetical protein
MKSSRSAIERFDTYLGRRNYAAHTRANYRLDLTLFFADKNVPPASVTHRDIEQFIGPRSSDRPLSATPGVLARRKIK